MSAENPFVGRWTYRSLLNDPDPKKSFNDLQFGLGEIHIEEGPEQLLTGKIGGDGWGRSSCTARAATATRCRSASRARGW